MKTFFASMLVAAGAMAIKIADPKDMQRARELGSQFVDSEAEALQILKTATKEEAMQFCSNPDNEKICDFAMKMSKKHGITEDDVAAWQGQSLAQIDENDLPSKEDMMAMIKEEMAKHGLTKEDVKQFCDGVDSDASEGEQELCGALAMLAKKGKGKGKKLAQIDENDLPSKDDMRAMVKEEMAKHGLTKEDVKGFCDGVDSDGAESEQELCGALAMLAKKGKGKGKKLAQIDENDLPSKDDMKAMVAEEMAKHGLTKEDVKDFCDGVDSGADESEQELCGALAMLAKKGKGKGKKLAQEGPVPKERDSEDDSEGDSEGEHSGPDSQEVEKELKKAKKEGKKQAEKCKKEKKQLKKELSDVESDLSDAESALSEVEE